MSAQLRKARDHQLKPPLRASVTQSSKRDKLWITTTFQFASIIVVYVLNDRLDQARQSYEPVRGVRNLYAFKSLRSSMTPSIQTFEADVVSVVQARNNVLFHPNPIEKNDKSYEGAAGSSVQRVSCQSRRKTRLRNNVT